MAVPGVLLVYAGWSTGVFVPALFGAPLIALGIFAFANTASSYLRVSGSVLTGRSLLDRVDIRVDDIARIVPINLSYRRTRLMPWNRAARVFEVCSSKGPTGLWLNPGLYGEAPIHALLAQMQITPETAVQNRVLDVFTRNRDYPSRRSE